MKGKGNTGHLIAVIVLSVLLLLGLALCGWMVLKTRTEALSQTKEPVEMGEDRFGGNQEDSWGEDLVTEVLGDFVLSPETASVTEQPQTGEDGAGNGAIIEPEQPAEENRSAYLCDYSSERLLTEADIAAIGAGVYEELPAGKNVYQMIINEIYARHGYQFMTPEIQAYFDQKEWYQAITERNSDMNAVLAGMSDVEKTNVQFLSRYGEEE